MQTADKPDHSVLSTAKPTSEAWQAEERAVLRRLFEIKRLKMIARGERRNMIDLKGASISAEAAGMAGAELEWAVTLHASEVLARLDLFNERWSGWEGFAAENTLTEPLRSAASLMGKSLGYAVALWNDLGAEWEDLWDHFDLETDPGEKHPRWQGFLAFFRVFQKARQTPGGWKTIAELAEKLLLQLLDASRVNERKPFAEGSAILALLKLCNISGNDLFLLKLRYTQWTSVQKQDWNALPAIAGPAARRDADGNESAVPWAGSFPISFESSFVTSVLNYVWFNAIQIEVDRRLPTAGLMRIVCGLTNGKPDFHCRVSLNDRACAGKLHPFVALLHELGHFVQSAHWMMELALADLIVERCSSHPGVDTLRLVEARRDLQKRITLFHSAAEVGADEFVVSILLPEEKIRAIYEDNFEGSTLHFLEYHADVCQALGVYSLEEYSRRFEPIVSDRAPNLTGPSKVIIRSPRLREARCRVSEKRILCLIDGFWEEVREILAPATASAI